MKIDMEWHDFVKILKKGKLFEYFFKFKKFKLRIYSKNSLSRPLLVNTSLWFFSRDHSIILDSFGNTTKVNILSISKCLIIFIISLLMLIPIYIYTVCYLFAKNLKKPIITFNPHGSVIYCKTDFWFGLKSGGSIAHTSGVLNALFLLVKPSLVFITTDFIPHVNGRINQNLYVLPKLFWDFPQFTAVASNSSFLRQSRQLISIFKNEISFVYHRYALNCFFAPVLSNVCGCPLVLEYNGSEVWVANNWGEKLKWQSLAAHLIRLPMDIFKMLKTFWIMQGTSTKFG